MDSYIKFLSIPITLHKDISNVNIYVVSHRTNIYIYDTLDIPDQNTYYLDSNNIPRTIVQCSLIYSHSIYIYPYLSYLDSFNYDNDRNVKYIMKLQKTNDMYILESYISKNVLYGRNIDKEFVFFNTLYNDIRKTSLTKCENTLKTIINTIDDNKKYNLNDFKNTELLSNNIILYDYQKYDIMWMKGIKKNIDNNDNIISYNNNAYNKILLDNETFLLNNRTIITLDSYDEDKIDIRYYGGNLISEMGLGKSLTMLYFLLDNKNKNDKYIKYENNKCNYYYKRRVGNCENKIIQNSENKLLSLYCRKHLKSLLVDKRRYTLQNINDFNIADYIITCDKTQYLKSSSSLIICPGHLCNQWINEYYSKFKAEKRILIILSHDQYKNITYADILFSDIIVISFNFIKNIRFNKSSVSDILQKYIINDGDNICDFEELKNNLNIKLLTEKTVNLSNFYFKNIILDEYNEINDEVLKKNILVNLYSKYRWNISGTPFSNSLKSFDFGITHVTNTKHTKYINGPNYIENSELIRNCSHLYKRNTIESVKLKYIINENIKLLEFTNQERIIYDGYNKNNKNKNFLIKLCCDSLLDKTTKKLIKNCKTLDEIQDVILSLNKVNLNKSKKQITNLEQDIILLEEKDCLSAYEKIQLSNCKRNLTNEKKTFDGINRTYTYLKQTIENITNNNDLCTICLDEITDIAITKCGHQFCKSCITNYLNYMSKNSKCPICKTDILLDGIYSIKESNSNSNSELENIIQNVKSTKIGNIIYYIKHELKNNDKCVIFTQWNEIMIKIKDLLEQSNINVINCTGSVYTKMNSINEFISNKDKNIIILSSDNAASGINLTIANKIIFVEPFYGSKEHRKDIESQGIGRVIRIGQKKPVEIIRFIIKNTIEEEIINE